MSVTQSEINDIGIELEHAIGYSGEKALNSLAYYPLEANKYVSAVGGCVVLGDIADPHEQLFFRGHTDDISCITVSDSGKILVSGQYGDESDVIVWDLLLKKMAYRFSEHDGGVEQVALSHDNRLLVTIGSHIDKKMAIWDLFSGNLVVAVNATPFPVRAVAWGGFVKDIKKRNTSNYLLATAGDRKLLLWSLDPFTGELKNEQVNVGAAIRDYTCMQFNEDCSLIFAGTTSGDVSVLNVRHKTLYSSFRACHGGIGYILCLGSNVLVGGGDGSFSVWELTTSIKTGNSKIIQKSIIKNLGGAVCSMCLSPDKTEVLVGTINGLIKRVRIDDCDGSRNPATSLNEELHVRTLSQNHCGGITYIDYSQGDSEHFATCSRDKTVRIWDANDYSVKTIAYGAIDNNTALQPLNLAFSLDALFTGWTDGSIRCHSSGNGSELWNICDTHKGGVSSLKLSHNNRFVISGGSYGEIRIWELRSRELVSHLKEHTGRVNEITLFNDDVHALSCSRDRFFLCWDLRKEKRVSSHSQRMGGINSIALSQDQTKILTVGQEKKITFWDLRERDPVHIIDEAHEGEATCISMSHKGMYFATGGIDQTVRLWDMRSSGNGELISNGIGHSGTVNSIRFAPDDNQVTSVGEDGAVFVWNVFG